MKKVLTSCFRSCNLTLEGKTNRTTGGRYEAQLNPRTNQNIDDDLSGPGTLRGLRQLKTGGNMSKEMDRINSRGLANGWHAQQLAAKTKEAQKVLPDATMADVFRASLVNTVAFSVPAKCTKVSALYTHYVFSDGSTAKFRNRERY